MNGPLPSGGNVYEITEDPEPGSTDLALPGNLNGGTASGEGTGGGEEVLPGGLHPGTGGHGAERPAPVSDHGPGPGTGHPLDGLPAQASGLLWLGTTVLALMAGPHLAGSCALGFAGFLGLWMLDRHKAPLRRSARLWSITLAALLLSTFLLSAGEMESVTAFRADVAERIHALRFGKEQLPEGHLDRAALLNGDSGEVLHIHAGQEKTLYLRAYVGAVYEDGVWTLLPDSAYGAYYSGMLEWLGEQDFAPLTQSAAYYALCTEDDLPESSHLTVDVKAGARCYLYLPGSVSSVAGASPRDIRDARLGARPSSARGFIRRRRPLPPAMWRGMISPPPPSKRAGPRAFPSRDRTPTPGRRSILTASAGPPGARRPPRGLLPQGGPAGKGPLRRRNDADFCGFWRKSA